MKMKVYEISFIDKYWKSVSAQVIKKAKTAMEAVEFAETELLAENLKKYDISVKELN